MCNMLLVLVLFHLFPFKSLGQYSKTRLDLYSRLRSAPLFLLLTPATSYLWTPLQCFFMLVFNVIFFPSHSLSLSSPFISSLFFCLFYVCMCAFQARLFECSLHLHWEIYTISLILIGCDDLVWRTKTARNHSSIRCSSVGSSSPSIRISLCIYLYT